MKHSAEIWDQFLEKNYNRLRQFVFRSFSRDPRKGEEVFSCVWGKLLENDRKRLTIYEGKNGASELTYLYVVCKRLIAECIRKRCKIPQKLLNIGSMLMIRAYDFLCCQKIPDDDTEEYLKDRVPCHTNPERIQEAIDIIHKNYPKCKEPGNPEEEPEEDNIASESGTNPDEYLEQKELIRIYRFILDIAGEENKEDWDWTGIADIKKRIEKHFNPSDPERVFLRMIYLDGMNITEAGKLTGWNKNQSHGRHRRLMENLRDIIGTDELRKLLTGE